MVRNFRISVVAFFWSLFLSAQEGSPVRQLELVVGEVREISLASSEEIKISRKGVIDFQPLSKMQARLVALKPGLVMIKTLGPDSPTPDTLLVEVLPKPKETKNEPEPVLQGLPQWICQNLTCRQDPAMISGSSSNFPLFIQARSHCLSQKNCAFYALLDDTGRLAWQAHLQNLVGPHWDLQTFPSGSAVALVSCPSGEERELKQQRALLDHLSGGLVSDKLLSVNCRKSVATQRYVVFAKVLLMNSSAAEQWGFDNLLIAQASTSTPQLMGTLTSNLKSFLKSKKAQVIGEPVIRTINGVKASAKSGGEFLSLKDDFKISTLYWSQKKIAVWKEYGLTLTLTLEALPENKALFNYDLSLKQPTQGHQQLHSNSMQSQVVLSLDQEAVVGGMKLYTEADDVQSVPLLSHLPLIGPFFQGNGQEKAESQIYLWVKLQEDNGLPIDGLAGLRE